LIHDLSRIIARFLCSAVCAILLYGQRLDGLQVVKDGIVACYLVDLGPHEVALVDTCNDRSAKAFLGSFL